MTYPAKEAESPPAELALGRRVGAAALGHCAKGERIR